MGLIHRSRRALLCGALPFIALSLGFSPALAQDDEDDQIIVTASMRQGGAQDVQHFRSIALDGMTPELPSTASLTLEGLLGEHDLTLPANRACRQMFCVATHAMPTTLAARSQDSQFIGIGFASNIDGAAARAEPISLIAVVDRSGSMSGAPIQRVQEALHAAIDEMRDGDRLGVVIYGSTSLVHQPPVDVAGNKDKLHAMVDAIAIDGSTSMEAGLRLGYQTALAELPQSRGRTRLMLFTDENPNPGNTSAEGFMAQAIAGTQVGVGLTTIGVGRHFDAQLATRIASVRGGNLFFLPTADSGRELFAREFTSMVAEVAQDLVISIDPAPGYRVTGVYGVPGEMIGGDALGGDGTVTVTVGSAFLSTNGGGIYASLAGDGGANLAQVTVSYTATATQARESDAETVLASTGTGDVPESLRLASLLVDEYFTVSQTLAQYQQDKDPAAAAEQFASLASRFEQSGLAGLDQEVRLVSALAANARQLQQQNLAMANPASDSPLRVMGDWRVLRHNGVDDIARGDLVAISRDGDFVTTRQSGRDSGEEIWQNFAINERQLHIEGTRLVFNWQVRDNRLTLRNRMDGTEIVLERI